MPNQTKSTSHSRLYNSVFFSSSLIVAICTILVTAVLSYMSYTAGNRNTDEGVQIRAGEVTTLIAKQSGGALKFGKVDVFEELFSDVFEAADGAAVAGSVYKRDEVLVSSYGDVAAFEDELSSLATQAIESGELARSVDGFTAAVPVRFGNDDVIVGAVAMRWTSALIRAQHFQEVLHSLLVAGLLGFGLLACGSFFLRMHLSRPLVRLRDAMAQVASENYDTEIPDQRRKDEIGDLSRALDTMRGDLQSAEAQLIAQNKEQEAASKEIAEMAAEREKAARREVEMAKEKEEADRKTAEAREQMMIDLGKSFGTVVEAAIDGEFSKRVDAKFSDKILNELAENINQLLGAVDHGLSETGQVLERIADGNLTQPMKGNFRGAFGHLQSNVNDMMEALKTLITEISWSGDTLGCSSAELRDTAGVLATQAERNAASLEETSAALDELSTSIRHVGENVSDASKNAQTARNMAQSSEKIAADAATSMDSISDASKEITRVVSVINEIAFQINLLALNAGVEAARAGEAGLGFAVVASEVRQLAQKASDASKEIATAITKSDAAVTEGVERVAGARSSLNAIAESVINISSGVDEISTAISVQVNGISEITSAVGQIDKSSQRQAASFEELTAASSVLASEADRLTQSTARFNTGQDSKVAKMDKPTASSAKARPKVAAVGGGQMSNEGWDEF